MSHEGKNHPRLAVLIVGYKSLADLPDCFDSLYASSYRDFEAVFVDCSTGDGSVKWIEEHYPQTVIFAEKENLGYAGGNNRGFEYILERPFTHVLVLNPDTVIEKECLGQLMDDPSDHEVRQPLILLHRDGKPTELVNTAGNAVHCLGFSYVGGYESQTSSHTEKVTIPVASGAAALIPTKALREVGVFSPDFFMYCEDLDLFWRMRMASYEMVLVPSAKIWHKYTFNGGSKRKFYYAERNRGYFLIRNFEWKTLLLTWPFHLLSGMMMLAYSLYSGWFIRKVTADWGVVMSLPRLLQERSEIQSSRKLNDHDLKELFTARFDFSGVSIPGLSVLNRLSEGYWNLVKKML